MKVTHLLTIGGDDTCFTASRVAHVAPEIRVAHVPKTIDNDLPLPEGVETVLARALDKEPGRRYGTASAFVTELELALAGKLATPPEEAPTQLLAVAEEAVAPPREPTPTPPPVPEQTPASQRATARRRVPRLLWVLGVLGALAILVGVVGIAWFSTGGRDEPTPTPSPQAAMQSTATLAPSRPPVAAEPECDDPAGCVTIGPDEPIQIGTIVYLSEPGGDLGAAAIRGIEMALEDKQRILEHPISLVAEHSGCEPDEGLRAAEALASNPGVLAVIGPTCSGAVQAAAERMCAGSIPLVSPSSAAPELTAPGRPPEVRCVLRTASHEATYAEAVAQFTMSRGVRRAATIQEANPLSESLVHVFSVHFQELGGEIVAREAVGPDSPDAAPIMERIAESEPQLVFLPLYVDWGAEITLLTRANPLLRDVALLGADGLFTRRYLAAAGEAAVGTFVSAPDIAVVGPAYVEFLARYEEVYGEPPRAPFHAPAYDAAMMIFAAIEDSALRLDDGTLIIRRQVLLERLFATRDFRGVTGNLSCTPSGDCGNSSVAVYEIVSPDPGHWHPGESPDNNPRRIWP